MKNSIGNRTRELSPCSAVPQPTSPTLARVAGLLVWIFNLRPNENGAGEPATRSISTFIALTIVVFLLFQRACLYSACVFVRLLPDLCLFPAFQFRSFS